jgi:hypothetical protein
MAITDERTKAVGSRFRFLSSKDNLIFHMIDGDTLHILIA